MSGDAVRKCVMVGCRHEARRRDIVCEEHAAHYRRRECDVDLCRWCGRRLLTVYALERGTCIDCEESTAEERAEALAKKEARLAARERAKKRQRAQKGLARAARKAGAA